MSLCRTRHEEVARKALPESISRASPESKARAEAAMKGALPRRTEPRRRVLNPTVEDSTISNMMVPCPLYSHSYVQRTETELLASLSGRANPRSTVGASL